MHYIMAYFRSYVLELICVSQPDFCQHGGTCSEAEGNTAACACLAEYTGDHCQTGKIDYLTFIRCWAYGHINPSVWVYYEKRKKYIMAYILSYVSELICVSQPDFCQHGGTCSEAEGNTASCDCLAEYTGDHCETGKMYFFTFIIRWAYKHVNPSVWVN